VRSKPLEKFTWMKKLKNTSSISFLQPAILRKYRLGDLKPLISFGASPRGSINLANAAKCYAFIKRRGYVIPEDVRAVVHDVLRHRIGITYEAEAENVTSEDIINKIVNQIEVP
jgi:MoxR-like ATPase